MGLISIIAELALGATTGFDLLLVGLILIISGGIGHFTNLTWALISCATLAFVYVLFARKFIKNRLLVKTHPTNIDALINQTGIVTKTITPHNPGQVKISGEIWRALSTANLATGTEITVKSVDGVTLIVAPSHSWPHY